MASEHPGPNLRDLAQRIAKAWTPDCWFGFIVAAIPEAVEIGDAATGGETVQHPTHFLVAVWEPVDAPPLPQFPSAAAIVSGTVEHAAAELLRLLAPEAKLLMLHRDAVNAALIADMILAGDRNLGDRYRAALEAFVLAERDHWRARIAADYTDRDEGYERFKAYLFGGGSKA